MGEIAKREETQVVQQHSPDTIMAVISRAAADPNTDVVKLEKLTELFERITARQAEGEFNAAMSDAQAKTRQVAADASNPQTKSKYASYAALDRALRPIYTDAGFSLSFDTADGAPQEWIRVVCYVAHKAGHTRTYHADMPADGKGAKGGDVMTKTHAAGSALTYGQRYLLKLIFNIAVTVDDDGNEAGRNVERITPEQVAYLNGYLDRLKADKSAFLRRFKIDSLENMPAPVYEDAVRVIKQKEERMKAAAK